MATPIDRWRAAQIEEALQRTKMRKGPDKIGQSELASRVQEITGGKGVTQQAISRYLKGRTAQMGPGILEAIEQALGIDLLLTMERIEAYRPAPVRGFLLYGRAGHVTQFYNFKLCVLLTWEALQVKLVFSHPSTGGTQDDQHRSPIHRRVRQPQ